MGDGSRIERITMVSLLQRGMYNTPKFLIFELLLENTKLNKDLKVL